MTEIYLETFILAPVEICFNLARSIDLHKISLEHTNEKAVDGRTSGLIEKGEFVTWRAKHFGINQTLSVKIAEMNSPDYFCDEMIKGSFKTMRHEHFFEPEEKGTLMTDKFFYEVPFSIFGKVFDALVLENYMKRLLQSRNQTIKRVAESGEWRKIINQ
ncbi:MAG: SRPBCC family protein [Pyrinomonadaceae bacterium]